MGFFDMGGSSSTPVASTATTDTVSTDTAISFDSSDMLMIDDSNVISFGENESASSLPNTAGELFQAPEVDASVLSFDVPEGEVVTSDSGFSLFSSPETAESTPVESDASESQISDLVFATESLTDEVLEEVTLEADVIPEVQIDLVSAGTAPSMSEEIVDADSTLVKAIAELEANASKIQTKVDAAFQQEASLLEEKSNQEAAHKMAMEALQKAAEEARKTALEIQKSGERTLELKKLFEAQLV